MSWSQKVRARIIANCYKSWIPESSTILDIGCGNGVVSKVIMEQLNINLIGADIIDYRIEDIPFKQIEIQNKLPFEDLQFKYAFFNDSLHHVKNIEELLLEAGRVAENVLIFEDIETTFIRLFDIAINKIYCSKMPCPLNFKTEQEWTQLFNKLGFTYEKGNITYPYWYFIRHMAFKLNRKSC